MPDSSRLASDLRFWRYVLRSRYSEVAVSHSLCVAVPVPSGNPVVTHAIWAPIAPEFYGLEFPVSATVRGYTPPRAEATHGFLQPVPPLFEPQGVLYAEASASSTEAIVVPTPSASTVEATEPLYQVVAVETCEGGYRYE